MNILILTSVFPPEVRSAAQIMFELAETLQQRGHAVTVLTSIPDGEDDNNTSFWARVYRRYEVSGIRVISVSTLPIHRAKAPAVIRGIGQLLNGVLFSVIGLFLSKVDVSISYSPPMTLGLAGLFLQWFKRVPHVFNVQDLVPQYAIDLGVLTDKRLIAIIRAIERFIYRRVRTITVHSGGNRSYIKDIAGDGKDIRIIPNWVDASLVAPGIRENDFRVRNNLQGKFIVLFAGILGFAQDLDTVLRSCVLLQEYKEIEVLIVGEGVEKERLVNLATELRLTNLTFHEFVSKERYPEVVAASDVCLAPLQKSLKCPVIPSKILGYMSGGRPVITSLDLDGDAPFVIRQADAGICVAPGEERELADAVIKLYKDPELSRLYGENGRKYILEHHDRQKCIAKYEEIFKDIVI